MGLKATPQPLKNLVESLTFEVGVLGAGKGTITISGNQTAISFDLANR